MKEIHVAAAIIIGSGVNENKIFATQRGYGNYKDWWEFPGGKLEPGETAEEALVREIREELDAEINVGSYFDTVEYDYPEFHVSMQCFLCTLASEHLELLEHEAARWLDKSNIDSVNWLPSDTEVVNKLKESVLV